MADNSALISLTNTLDLILCSQRSHIFHANQWLLTLCQKVQRLQALLDDSPQNSSQEVMNSLETRIVEWARMIEGLVEMNVLEQVPMEPKGLMAFDPLHMNPNYEIPPEHLTLEVAMAEIEFLVTLEVATVEIDFIVEELLNGHQGLKCVLPRKYSYVVGSSKRVQNTNNSNMVGFDEDMMALKDRLTRDESKLQTIPIVGMGGSGKTTLAMNLYNDSLIVQRFDIRAWVTISQTYAIGDVVQALLKGIRVATNESHVQDLLELLYKNLKGRRYLIVLDDMWSTKVWDDLRRIFPDDANRSRIIITTRIGDLAEYVTDVYSPPHKMHLLDANKSWDLLCHKVFSQEGCPLEYKELEDIGKLIAQNCKGLPLSTSVIGGLLANSSITQEFWEYVAGNVNSITLENDEHCSEILSLSYNHLPSHLKLCFLYFGPFPEDYEISTTKLINLWIAEGFLKPIRSKTSEEVAQEYLNQLINRNLVIVSQKGSNEKAKSCTMHDLLRDLSAKEAKKDNFLHIINRSIQQSSSKKVNTPPRLLSIHRDILNNDDITDDMHDILHKSARCSTTLLCTGLILCAMPFYRSFAFLRVLDFLETRFSEFPLDICGLVALRYVAFSILAESCMLPSSVIMSRLWKLQILIIRCLRPSYMPGPNRKILFMAPGFFGAVFLPLDILQMANLRHLQMKMCVLPDPIERNDPVILKELVTLSKVLNFKCTEEVLKKFPNLRKLGIHFDSLQVDNWSIYHLKNIARMSKLENLKCEFNSVTLKKDLLSNLIFPCSLKKLTLSGSSLFWKDITIIGSLPLLEVLKLKEYAFVDDLWEAVEGEFCRLKFLLIEKMELVRWIAESVHFPCLKHLKIEGCPYLEKIPCGIGEIDTLEMIEINNSSTSVVASAWQILEEQHDMGNEVLQVHATASRSLADRGITISVTKAALRVRLALYVSALQRAGYASSEIKEQVDTLLAETCDPDTGVTSGMTFLEKNLADFISQNLSKEGIDENSTVYVDVRADTLADGFSCQVKKNGQLVEIVYWERKGKHINSDPEWAAKQWRS